MVDMPTSPVAPSVQAYKNPFDTNVLDTAVRQINDATSMRRNQLGTEAFGAGAFGDARHGIESSKLTEDAMRVIGDVTGDLNQRGFESAMGWFNTDLDRQTNAGFQNAMLDQNWLNSQIDLLNTGSNLGQLDLTNQMSFADALRGLDQYDRDWMQQNLNVDFEDFLAQEGWDENRMALLQSIVAGYPIGQTTTGFKGDSVIGDVLGALLNPLGKLFGG